MLKPSGLTMGSTIVRVAVHEAGRARVGAVAAQEVVGELHGVLGRGPLARVVDAHVQEDRLAVVDRRRVRGDLDGVHVAAQDGLVREHERPDQGRVPQRELLELELVVGQPAIRVAPAGQVAGDDPGGVLAVGPAVGARAAPEVGDLHVIVEAVGAQDAGVPPAVQDHLQRAAPPVLREVDTELGQPRLGRPGRRAHLHDLGALAVLAGRHGVEADAQARRAGVAPVAAGLHDERLPLAHEALRELVRGEAGRAGDAAPGPRVEHAEVPVARPERRAWTRPSTLAVTRVTSTPRGAGGRQAGVARPRLRLGRADRGGARGRSERGRADQREPRTAAHRGRMPHLPLLLGRRPTLRGCRRQCSGGALRTVRPARRPP